MFRDITYYQPDVEACMARVRGFFDGVAGNSSACPSALIITFPAVLSLPGPVLCDYDFENDIDSYLDDFIEYQAQLIEVRRGLADDWIPSVVPYMGIGEFSAFVAGEIEFGRDTSWVHPVLRDYSDLDRLTLDPSNKWFVRLNYATRYIMERISKARIPLGRGYYSPLDLAWALRGGDIYTDFYESPEWVHKLLSFAADATTWFARAQADIIASPEFHHELAQWYCSPTRIAVSEDISSLCSPAHYGEFAAPYTQKVFDSFGIGEVHCHAAGPHVLPELLKLRNVRQIQIVADPNQRRPVEILAELISNRPELFGTGRDRPVMAIDASADEIEEHYDLCKFTRLVFSVVTETAEQANDAIRVFRAKSDR